MAETRSARREPFIGRPMPRLEDARLVTGRGRYTDDVSYPGEAFAAFVRSPHPDARIVAVDAVAARGLAGVLAVITAADYAAAGGRGIRHFAVPADAHDVKKAAFHDWRGPPPFEMAQPVLAADRTRYVGEPIAMVVADTAAVAREAAERVAVAYEALPAVTDVRAALAPGAPLLHDAAPGNLAMDMELGDAAAVAAACAGAHLVVTHAFRAQRIVNAQMEPRAAIGAYDAASGILTALACSQGANRLKTNVADSLGLAPEKVRAITPDVGGGFGLRNNSQSEQILVAFAARALVRPVKWLGDRAECFLSDFQGRDMVTEARLALDRDGRILAMSVDHIGGLGAYPVSYVWLSNAYRVMPTVYDVPLAHLRVRAALTNTVPTAPFRGAGRPEAHHVIERLLDIAARRLGMDRAELRRRNLVRRKQLPYRSATGLTYDSGDFRGNMARALELSGWREFPARKRAAKKRGLLAGIGLANYVESPVGIPVEYVRVTVDPTGVVEAVAGTQSTGQGHETTFAQVLADQLGVTPGQVRLVTGDTDVVPKGGGTHSDRSMRLAGTLLVRTSERIVAKARAVVAALVGVRPDDVAFDDGLFHAPQSNRRLDIFDVARAIDTEALPPELKTPLTSEESFHGRIPAYPTGCAIAEVEVDPLTGAVTLTRYASVDDAGRAINPLILHGQVHGGIVQGAGQALIETTAHDAAGHVLAGSFMDYAIPRADMMPSLTVELAEDPTSG
ncbi:MAG TPA: xanthine dehydrogenase family protein molybdopterin-binding subunit, partial [Xanthobacteraceae bacterium]|nr:xanthine dehydrogenase family protein molybdopterin-binding subunit [Xanthobacteraceae bacterium]